MHILMVESALELVPKRLWSHPTVASYAKRIGKDASWTILDGNYHHSAMRRLEDSEKRGRPDIVHMSLLVAQGSILNREGLLRTYVHTVNDELIEVDPTTRLPRNQERFKGVMAKVLSGAQVKEDGEGKELLKLTKGMTVKKILARLAPDKVYVLDDGKEVTTLSKVLKEDGLPLEPGKKRDIVLIVGGFPHGDFSTDMSGFADRTFSVYKDTLELWTVLGVVIHDVERALGLH